MAHAIFGIACYYLLNQQKSRAPSRPLTWIQLEPTPVKPPQPRNDTQEKVVQSNVGKVVDKAVPDAHLGEKNRVVDRQTVSSKKLTVMGQKAMTTASKAVEGPKDRKDATARPKGGSEPAKTLSSLGLPILPSARRPGIENEPVKDEPRWANVGVEAQDYINGIKQSDRTALNTREYAYFGYHQRIRKRLEIEWNRLLREALTRYYKKGRQLASDTDYSTKVLVILNDRGEIKKVKLVSMSGTQELDDVAVEAFNRAGPFPNPPKGIVKNGEVEVPWELKLRS